MFGILFPPSGARSETITLFHFNDFHSQMEPRESLHGERRGGAAHLAGAIAIARDQAGPSLLLFDGDLFQGTPYYNFFHGEPEIRLLNLMGVDAMTLGNHEFDSGAASLANALTEARFPVLSANVVLADSVAGAPFQEPAPDFTASAAFEAWSGATDAGLPAGFHRPAAPWAVYRVGGITVGVVGATTEALRRVVLASVNPGLRALPVASTIHPFVKALRPRVDLLVLLSHCGIAADSVTAQAVPGIDVIVAGHDHEILTEPILVRNGNRNGIGGTLIVEAGSRGRLLGRLDLTIENGSLRGYRGRVLPVGPAVPPDPRVLDLVESYRGRLSGELDEVVTVAPQGLSAVGRRTGDTPLGNLVAEVMRRAGNADIGIENSGGIRASIPPGEVTLGQIYMILPFENEIVTCRLTGAQIEALANDIAGGKSAQVAGLRFAVVDGHAEGIQVGGRPLLPEATYRVAVNDFMYYGGDDFDRLAEDSEAVFTGVRLRDAVLDSLRRTPRLLPDTTPRILRPVRSR